MNMDRKNFIRSVGLGALGALAAPSLLAMGKKGAAAGPAVALPQFDEANPESYWRGVRDLYGSLDRSFVYFNTAGLGPASTPVLNAFTAEMLERQKRSDTGHDHFAVTRKVVARFFGAKPEEVCLTRNTTEGTCIIASGMKFEAGDEVIIDSHAHPGGALPWYNQHETKGVVVKVFEPVPTTPEQNLEAIRALITPRTKLIQISYVTSPTGIILPAADIGRLAHKHGIWFHIDGAQSGGILPFQFRDLECDSYCTSGHKWIGATHESGIFIIREERLNDIAPSGIGAYSGMVPYLPGELTLVPDATRYEYGTRNAATAVALAEALNLQSSIGRERIFARGKMMVARLRAGLEKNGDVEILTPSREGMWGAILAFRSPKLAYDKMFGELLGKHQLRCRPVSEQNLNALRVSPHVFNFPEEVDRLVEAVGTVLKKA